MHSHIGHNTSPKISISIFTSKIRFSEILSSLLVDSSSRSFTLDEDTEGV